MGTLYTYVKQNIKMVWSHHVLVLVLLLLIGCRATDDVGDMAPPTDIFDPATSGEQLAQPTTMVSGEKLPGRLLFVQNGTIWLWQGQQGAPLLGDGTAWQPAWSPNGTRIAYVNRGESYSDIILADAQGITLEQLTTNESSQVSRSHERIYESQWAFYPTWSPDNTDITIVAQFGPPTGSPAFEYNLSLYTLPVAGGVRRQIYAEDNVHVGTMVYTADSSSIIYTRTEASAEGQQQLYRLDLVAGSNEPLPGAPTLSYDPAISSDGNWVVFAARDEDRTDIWVLPENAASDSEPAPQRLTSLGMARSPAFSPDGQLLAFLAVPEGQNGFELWVADLSRDANGTPTVGTPRQITQNMRLDVDSGLSWAP